MISAANKKQLQPGMPDYLIVCSEKERLESREIQNKNEFGDICVEFMEEAHHLAVFLTAASSSVKWIKLRWNYDWPENTRFLGDAWERGYGDLEWRGSAPARHMPWYFAAAQEKQVFCCGVKTRPSAMCFWQTDPEGITLVLDVRCGGDGVKLSGRKLHAADVVWTCYRETKAYDAVHDFCGEMCTDPILPPHVVYGSNNWYYAYGDSSEEQILKDCTYIAGLTDGIAERPYMVIDDCWQEHHRLNKYNGGPWTCGNEKFPDMKALAQKMKDKGVRPGIWVRLLQNEDKAIPSEWRLSGSGALDPSHPEALAYIKRDVRRLCEWGYQLLKHDFSTVDLFGKWGFMMNPLVTDGGWHFYNESLTSAEVVKLLYQAILEECQSFGTLILGCNTMGHLGAGYMHISRTGDDTSGHEWERTRKMGVNTLAFRLPQHGKFFEVDADCVGIDGTIPWKLNGQWADLLAKSGTVFFASTKPDVLSESEENMLRECMQIAAERKYHLTPCDWMSADCPGKWSDEETKTVHQYHWYGDTGAVIL